MNFLVEIRFGKSFSDVIPNDSRPIRNQRKDGEINNVHGHVVLRLPYQHENFGGQNAKHNFRNREYAEQQWHVVTQLVYLFLINSYIFFVNYIDRNKHGKPSQTFG